MGTFYYLLYIVNSNLYIHDFGKMYVENRILINNKCERSKTQIYS